MSAYFFRKRNSILTIFLIEIFITVNRMVVPQNWVYLFQV